MKQINNATLEGRWGCSDLHKVLQAKKVVKLEQKRTRLELETLEIEFLRNRYEESRQKIVKFATIELKSTYQRRHDSFPMN